MSESFAKQHPLSSFMKTDGARRVVAPCVNVLVEPDVCHVSMRGNPADPAFVSALSTVMGQPVPERGRVTRDTHSVYWLGPQEFLVTSRQFEGRELVSALSSAFEGVHAAATDLSGGQILLAVSGTAARAFLSKASTLDLHESMFSVDDCAQSTFAKAGALYALRSDEPVFELIIRRSFADYAARWMLHGGQEFGIKFAEQHRF